MGGLYEQNEVPVMGITDHWELRYPESREVMYSIWDLVKIEGDWENTREYRKQITCQLNSCSKLYSKKINNYEDILIV